MNNQREIYEALLAGETLDNREFSCSLNNDGHLIDDEGDLIHLTFSRFSEWQIYKEPKWYENIDDGGVLCWVSSSDKCIHSTEKTMVAVINDYQINSPYKYNFVSTVSTRHLEATPLTKQEIQVFMDNAPEEL